MANTDFYRLTAAYDLAFSDRDYNEECDYHDSLFRTHCAETYKSLQRPSFLELACGPANHARIFAQRGWECAGLDLSGAMLDYAREKDKQTGVSIEYFLEDMSVFTTEKQYHFILNPLESISHLTTNEQMLQHFRAVHNALLPGGVYVIEGTHPRFFFPDELENRWTVTEGSKEVELLFGKPNDEYDAVTQIWKVTTELTYKEEGVITAHTQSVGNHRWYLTQEFDLFVRLTPGLKIAAFYGSYDIPPAPLDDSEDAEGQIVVITKDY